MYAESETENFVGLIIFFLNDTYLFVNIVNKNKYHGNKNKKKYITDSEIKKTQIIRKNKI